MKLINLSLKGFRQHKETYLEFKNGLTGIIGPNGSGKSSLIEAVAFCFYGSKAIRGKLDQVKTLGSGPKQEVEAVLSFEHDNVNYRLERTLSDACLYLGGESSPITRGTVDVSNKIASIFSMNYEEFTATFFTEQKGLEFLSGKKGAADRERFIVRLMGYDKLQETQELLRNDKNDKKNSIIGAEASLGDRAKIVEVIAEEERSLKLANEKLKEARKAFDLAEKETLRLKQSYDALNSKYLEYSKAKIEIEKLNALNEERSRRLKSMENRIALFQDEDLLSLAGTLKETEKQITNTLQKIESIKTKSETENTIILEKELSSKAEIKSLISQIESLKEKNVSILGLNSNSQCPTCGQAIGSALLSVKNSISEEISSLESILKDKQNSLNQTAGLKMHVQKAILELTHEKEKLKKLTESKDALNERLQQAKNRQSLFEEIKNLQTEIRTAEEAASNLLSADSILNFSESEYQANKTQYEASEGLLHIARLQHTKVEGELEMHSALLKRSRESLLDYDEKAASIEAIKKELALLERSDQVLTDLRKHLNAQLRPRLSQIASEFLSELSDGRYSTVDIGIDFSPRLIEDGELKAVISGGEEDLLNLCLRLALSNMLAERAGLSFSTLILDEVFGALDDNRRENVILLLEKLSKRFEQILIITHLEDIKEGVHNLVSINYNEAKTELEIMDRMEFQDNDLAVNL